MSTITTGELWLLLALGWTIVIGYTIALCLADAAEARRRRETEDAERRLNNIKAYESMSQEHLR